MFFKHLKKTSFMLYYDKSQMELFVFYECKKTINLLYSSRT